MLEVQTLIIALLAIAYDSTPVYYKLWDCV